MRAGIQDRKLLLGILAYAGFGLLILLSASSYEAEKLTGSSLGFFWAQAAAMVVGLTVMVGASQIDYRFYWRGGWFLWGLCLALLGLVAWSPWGVTANGAERWLQLGPLRMQPSELVKPTVIFLMAGALAKGSLLDKRTLGTLLAVGVLGAFVLEQPDLGTTVLLGLVIVVMMFVRGLSLAVVMAIGLSLVAVAERYVSSTPYQLARIRGWLHPESDPLAAGYNLLQAEYAIGLGGILGSGYGNSLLKQNYLPVSYSDFIFAILSEELGLVGVVLLLGALVAFLWRGMDICIRFPGRFGKLLGIGIICLLLLQAIFNLGGVVGLLPVTGIPLPLVSYGKSSLLVSCWMLGILLNLSRGPLRARPLPR